MSVEETFDLLADAAQVRYPHPDRTNRGLCPAHGDHNNPGLVFRISAETGNLIAYCFSQGCSAQDIAASIGVPLTSFFPGSHAPGQIHVPIKWWFPSALELLKLLQVGYSWDEQVDAVFRVLGADDDIGYLVDGAAFHEIPKEIMDGVYLWAYLQPHWLEQGVPWRARHDEPPGYADQAMRRLGRLSQQYKTNNLSHKEG